MPLGRDVMGVTVVGGHTDGFLGTSMGARLGRARCCSTGSPVSETGVFPDPFSADLEALAAGQEGRALPMRRDVMAKRCAPWRELPGSLPVGRDRWWRSAQLAPRVRKGPVKQARPLRLLAGGGVMERLARRWGVRAVQSEFRGVGDCGGRDLDHVSSVIGCPWLSLVVSGRPRVSQPDRALENARVLHPNRCSNMGVQARHRLVVGRLSLPGRAVRYAWPDGQAFGRDGQAVGKLSGKTPCACVGAEARNGTR